MAEYYKIKVITTKPNDPAIQWMGDHETHSETNTAFLNWCRSYQGFVRFTNKMNSPTEFERDYYFTDKESADAWQEARKALPADQIRKQYLQEHGFTFVITEGDVDEDLPPLPPTE